MAEVIQPQDANILGGNDRGDTRRVEPHQESIEGTSPPAVGQPPATPEENRKLGRVGQRYGSKKEVEKKEEVQNNFSYSKRDYVPAYPEGDSGSIEDTINKFISNLTGDKSDRVGSQYYRTG